MCFGTRDTQYGDFSVSYGGKIAGFKLVHLSGYVTCGKRRVSHYSFWGCGDAGGVKNHVNVVITTSSNHVIVPPSEFFTFGNGKWSEIPGYNSMSPEIVLPSFSPYSVRSGDQFRLWYGEDLVNFTEHDNGGRVCADVYALYAWEALTSLQLQARVRQIFSKSFYYKLNRFLAAAIKGYNNNNLIIC